MRIQIDDSQVAFKSRNVSELVVMPRKVEVIGNFNEESAKKLYTDIDTLVGLNQKTIPIFIDSYGGLVHSLNGMADYLSSLKRDGYEIVTIACGKAMSCGAMLFMLGDRRYVGPRTTVMLHRLFSLAVGNADDLKANMEHGANMEKILFEECSESIGKKKGWLFKQLQDRNFANWYVPAKECLETGIATHIGIPRMTVSINTKFELEL